MKEGEKRRAERRPEPGGPRPEPGRHPLPGEHLVPPEPRGPKLPGMEEGPREIELRAMAESLVSAFESDDHKLKVDAVVNVLSQFEGRKPHSEPKPEHPRPPVPGEHHAPAPEFGGPRHRPEPGGPRPEPGRHPLPGEHPAPRAPKAR